MSRDDSLMRDVLTDAARTDLERRYEHRRRLWHDGPYGGSVAFDRVMEREVGLYIAYNFTDIPAFVRRAKVRGRLRHPHLLPVLDFGMTADNLPYFTEPYVDAVPLDSLFRGAKDHSPGSLPRLVRAVAGVCRAVAHAHAHGACHLDLTPESVYTDVALEDVFLTGGFEDVAAATEAGAERAFAHGFTPGYAAPEQVNSPPELPRQGLWRAVDVYGLGGVIYWLLYDSPPNRARPGADGSLPNLVQSLAKSRGAPPPGQLRPALRASAPKAVAGLSRIALKALHTDPRERYPAVGEMTADLEKWLVDHRDRS
jgi:eukaryotic-like serine/threonine-protein kinase